MEENNSKILWRKITVIAVAAVIVIAAIIVVICLTGKDKKENAGLADSTGELSSEENYEKTGAVKETGKDEDTQEPTTETTDEDTPETSLETLKKLGKEELVDLLLNDVKVMGFSINEFKEIPQEEILQYAIDQYGLDEYYKDGSYESVSGTKGDARYDFTTYDGDWCLDYSGEGSFCDLKGNDDGEFSLWICGDSSEVTLPDGFFSLEDSAEDAEVWCEEWGVFGKITPDSEGNSELSLSIALDDGKYLNFSYGAEGKLSVEINKNCFDWALN